MTGAASCTEVVGPVWETGGESCACTLDAVHVFDPDHDAHCCSCGAWWYDEEQIARALKALPR